tara:strand:- start:33 stop:1121 length:1089 start_codon:yes stop_codon:yes gene_type:complete
MKSFKKILIATGGTGGHVFPAYGLAEYLKKKEFYVEVLTDKRGLKFIKNFKDLKLKIISSETIFKKNPLAVILSFFKIITAFFQSILILFKLKPAIVFGMGGYSSFPVCIAAKILRIPFIIYENNLVLGRSNKFLLPFASKILVAYSDLEGLKKKYEFKKFETGNILREEIINFNLEKSSKDKSNISILILGGSQAAKMFGEILPQVFLKCKKNNINLKIFQQCLSSQNDFLKKQYNSSNIYFELFNFTNNILDYFSKVDLAITRAGSSMTAELINCRIPFISVPFPHAIDDHQLKNAKYFETKGYNFLVEEKEIDKKLFHLIKSIHEDKDLLTLMKSKQKSHSDKRVFEKVLKEIQEFIND